MPHKVWKDKCVERFAEYQSRAASASSNLASLETGTVRFLHRLIPKDHIEPKEKRPKHSRLSDADLSVLLEGPSMPQLNIDEAVSSSRGKYVGAWKIPVSVYPAAEPGCYEIHHDPFPDGVIEPHPNHGMVFCNKGNPKCREAVSEGSWSVKPPDDLFTQIEQEEQERIRQQNIQP
jgi:hypothetical protein